jgi:hypothetical protein
MGVEIKFLMIEIMICTCGGMKCSNDEPIAITTMTQNQGAGYTLLLSLIVD